MSNEHPKVIQLMRFISKKKDIAFNDMIKAMSKGEMGKMFFKFCNTIVKYDLETQFTKNSNLSEKYQQYTKDFITWYKNNIFQKFRKLVNEKLQKHKKAKKHLNTVNIKLLRKIKLQPQDILLDLVSCENTIMNSVDANIDDINNTTFEIFMTNLVSRFMKQFKVDLDKAFWIDNIKIYSSLVFNLVEAILLYAEHLKEHSDTIATDHKKQEDNDQKDKEFAQIRSAEIVCSKPIVQNTDTKVLQDSVFCYAIVQIKPHRYKLIQEYENIIEQSYSVNDIMIISDEIVSFKVFKQRAIKMVIDKKPSHAVFRWRSHKEFEFYEHPDITMADIKCLLLTPSN